jgi:dihydroxyacetone kinase-like protein
MSQDGTRIEGLVEAAARTIIDRAAELTALDQAIGDGDHGANMKRGMEAVLADLPKQVGKPAGEVLKAVGLQLVMKVGGASGPLYGTLAMEFGKSLPAAPSRPDVTAALDAAIAAVKMRGKSDVGQKTLIDVLVPVRAALAGGAAPAALATTAEAAAEATAPVRATRGRASFLGERSIGHVDPGARSCALMIGAICQAMGQ